MRVKILHRKFPMKSTRENETTTCLFCKKEIEKKKSHAIDINTRVCRSCYRTVKGVKDLVLDFQKQNIPTLANVTTPLLSTRAWKKYYKGKKDWQSLNFNNRSFSNHFKGNLYKGDECE